MKPSDPEPNSDCRLWALRGIQVRYTVSCQPLPWPCPVLCSPASLLCSVDQFLSHRALCITVQAMQHQGLQPPSISVYGASYHQRREWLQASAKGDLEDEFGEGTLQEVDLRSPHSPSGPECWAIKTCRDITAGVFKKCQRSTTSGQKLRGKQNHSPDRMGKNGRKRMKLHRLLCRHTPNSL